MSRYAALIRLPFVVALIVAVTTGVVLAGNLFAQSEPPMPPQGAPVRVYFADQSQLAALAAYDIWEVNRADGYAIVYAGEAERAQLQAAGFRVEDDPVKAAEFLASLPVFPGDVAAADAASIPGYACYRTVEESYSALANLAAQHPDLARWTDIGDSWEKMQPGGAPGYDLYALVLTNQSRPGPKPRLFIAAATHARELATAELAVRFAELLVTRYGVDPDVTWLLDYHELHLVAQANPDGRKQAEAGAAWRKNTNNQLGCTTPTAWGVDLNRNHSFKWSTAGVSTDPCSNIYLGPSAASEPETQAIEAYGRSLFADRRGPGDADPAPADTEGLMITLHSYGNLVLHSWGWSAAPAPNATQLATLGRKFGFYNGYTVGAGNTTLYATSGDMDDWFYGTLGVPAYTIELGTAFFQSCSYFESNIVNGNLQALLYAFKTARRPYQTPAGPEVTGVTLSASAIAPGAVVTLTAQAADNRYSSGEASQTVQAARYTVDTPAWAGGATYPLAAADGAFDEVSETLAAAIPTAGLALGRHTIFVEAQDANGVWGVPTAIFLTVTDQPLPTGTPTATPTATSTPAPAGCTSLLLDGGFESGAGWTFASTPATGGLVSEPIYTGGRAARLGVLSTAANVYAYSSVYQRVTLPAAAQITLRYWERPGSAPAGVTDNVDLRETLLLNNNAGFLTALDRSRLPGDDLWRQRSFDLSAYAGQRVMLYFNVYNNGAAARAWNYLDAVEVLACTGDATPSPTPTATATSTAAPTITPVPTGTPSPSPTPATPPAACRETVSDGGFETTASWRFGSTPARGVYVATAHTGAQAVRLGLAPGATNGRAFSTVYQRVTIPQTTTDQVLLTWWERATGAADGADYREVLLLNTDYSRLRTVEKSTSVGSESWTLRSFDLSAFAGRTLVLYFNVYNNGAGAQQANFLDDVSLALCPQPAAATVIAPQPDPDAAEPVAADALVASPAVVYLDDSEDRRTASLYVANLNPGGQALGWTATSDVDWLAVTERGVTPGEFTVAVVGDARDAGVYQGAITLQPEQAAVEAVEIPVFLAWGLDERLFLPLVVQQP